MKKIVDLDAFETLVNRTEFTFCKDCLFWGIPEGNNLKRCLKNAPIPRIDRGSGLEVLVVEWPVTREEQGCFEGVPRSKVMVEQEEEGEESQDSYDTEYIRSGEGLAEDDSARHRIFKTLLEDMLRR